MNKVIQYRVHENHLHTQMKILITESHKVENCKLLTIFFLKYYVIIFIEWKPIITQPILNNKPIMNLLKLPHNAKPKAPGMLLPTRITPMVQKIVPPK